jgi:AcrR family transcriptional regulator
VSEGQRPTVAEAADAALVSRATAYRYFPSQRALLVEAALAQSHPADGPSFDEVPDGDLFARFDVVCRALFERVTSTEGLMRQMLAVTQEEWLVGHAEDLPLRQGRRLGWIERALEPVRERLGDESYAGLVNGVAMVVGVEPYVVLRDVCGLDQEAALQTMLWAGGALIAKSLQEPPATSSGA